MKPGAPMQECEKIKNGLINNGFQINEIVGVNMTILGVIGDTSTLDINLRRVNDWVERSCVCRSRSNAQTGCSIRKTA